MDDVIDVENKERLIEEIYKAVKLSLPDDAPVSDKTELHIELIEEMLDNALGTNPTGRKRFCEYGLNLER
jgi:hypothetical protein